MIEMQNEEYIIVLPDNTALRVQLTEKNPTFLMYAVKGGSKYARSKMLDALIEAALDLIRYGLDSTDGCSCITSGYSGEHDPTDETAYEQLGQAVLNNKNDKSPAGAPWLFHDNPTTDDVY